MKIIAYHENHGDHDSSCFYIKKTVHQQANCFAISLHFLAFGREHTPKQGKEKGYSP
jgi:hypothetical protein